MPTPTLSNHRLVSLDVMRGLIMILLAGEACRVWDSLHELSPDSPFGAFMEQFFHHPWNGLRFWDLIQPAFMTMAGTAMYLSYFQKEKKGISWEGNWKHILWRSLKLLLFGTALHVYTVASWYGSCGMCLRSFRLPHSLPISSSANPSAYSSLCL